MKFSLDLYSKEPMYAQIVSQLKEQIILDYITCGDILPSIRVLSSENEVSSITVIKAYQVLSDEGVIVSSQSKGHFLSDDAKGIISEQYKKEIEKNLLCAARSAAAIGLNDEDVCSLLKTLWAKEVCHSDTLDEKEEN